jgi:methylmalonyl-CoA mutase cobalamin-binding domain/chain
MTEYQGLFDAVIKGDAAQAKLVTEDALKAGTDPETLINEYMIPAMDEVGKRYDEGVYYIPELLISARAMKTALELIRPLLAEQGAEPAGRVVIGTVAGDLHDIGKNLVASMLEGGGFEVIDLGTDVTPAKFVQTAREKDAGIVALSALLSTTMPGMKAVVEEVAKEGMGDTVKVVIGGAPVTKGFAKEIGAAGYASNARGAVVKVRELLGL